MFVWHKKHKSIDFRFRCKIYDWKNLLWYANAIQYCKWGDETNFHVKTSLHRISLTQKKAQLIIFYCIFFCLCVCVCVSMWFLLNLFDYLRNCSAHLILQIYFTLSLLIKLHLYLNAFFFRAKKKVFVKIHNPFDWFFCKSRATLLT